MTSATALPLAVALLALIGVLAGVLVQRQRNRLDAKKQAADERAEFMASVLAEVKSLREAERLTDARLGEILEQLQQAQRDILDCYRERNELALRVSALQQQVDVFQRRHRDDHDRPHGEGR